MGLGRPAPARSRVRVKEANRTILPLSVDEVARFWSSFRTSRDPAIVGLMLLQGLRSREVIALNRDDVLFPEAQIRVRGKGNNTACYPWLPKPFSFWITTSGWSGPMSRRRRCSFP